METSQVSYYAYCGLGSVPSHPRKAKVNLYKLTGLEYGKKLPLFNPIDGDNFSSQQHFHSDLIN